MNEREIFQAALDFTEPVELASFLDQTCAGDTVLRARVEALLASHESASRFLDIPALEQLHPLNPAATSRLGDAEDDPESDADRTPDLSFLAPAREPGSLGMLGHYHILQLLGQGAFGLVFKAFDERLHRHVAVKVMNPQLAATSPPRKRFLREARSAAAIKHENIVQVYDVEEQPLPYLVMEYVDGQTLKEKLDNSGPLEVAEILHLGRQIASGLAAAHARGLIHRDIKPGNILIEAGAERRVKITDFGLARAADDATMTRTGVISGTPMYMAPEQAQGLTLDHRVDLFSLGSVLYQMACGRPPFRGANPLAVLKRVTEEAPRPLQEIFADVPDWLCAIIARLQAKNPDERFQSGQEVADLLARCQASLQQNVPVELPADVMPFLPTSANVPHPESAGAVLKTPAAERKGPLVRSRGLAVAGCVLLLLAVVLGTVMSLSTSEGTLVVEVEDPDVSVSINNGTTSFRAPGAHAFRLKSGEHRVLLRKGYLVREEIVQVTRNGRQVLRIGKDSLPDVTATDVPQKETAVGIVPQPDAGDPDRRAAEYILSIGGIVQVNQRVDPIKEVAALPKGPLQLTHVYLTYNQEVTDAGLAVFDECRHLKCLALSATPIGDAGLAHFQASRGLEHLHVHSAFVTDAGLRHFRGLDQLRNLKVSSSRVTDAGLANFAACRDLTWLDLNHTPVTDAGVAPFADCKDLKVLALGETRVTDAGLAKFQNCPDLERLLLFRSRITNQGLESLVGLKQLNFVELKGSKATAEGIEKLAAGLPDCRIEWDGDAIDPKADPDRRAAEYILSLGSRVRIDGEPEFVTSRDQLPKGRFRLTWIDVPGNPLFTEQGWANLEGCRYVTHLVFLGTPVSDAGLAHLRACKGLVTINLDNTGVGDAGLAVFKDCAAVQTLRLLNSRVTDAGLAQCRSFKQLTLLDVRGMRQITAAGLGNFQDCRELATLQICDTQIGDDGLAFFKDCPKLAYLDLIDTPVSDAGLEMFQNHQQLTDVIANGTNVTDAGVASLKNCPKLAHVSFDRTRVTAAGLASLKDCPLKLLHMNGTSLGDESIEALSSLTRLEHVSLRNTKVTEAGVQKLAAALPFCRIEWDGGNIEPKPAVK